MALEQTSPSITDSLIALRDQYQAVLNDTESKANQVREQLNHINALLVDQLVPREAVSSTNDWSSRLRFAPTITEETLLVLQGEPELISSPATPEMPATELESFIAEEPIATRPGRKKAKSTAESAQPLRSKVGTARQGTPATPSLGVGRYLRETALPLMEPYQGMSKINAVTKVMQERAGDVIHIDEIIRTLHGSLGGETLRLERGRMRNVMQRGLKQKLWERVKGRESSYRVPLMSAAKFQPTVQPIVSPVAPAPLAPKLAQPKTAAKKGAKVAELKVKSEFQSGSFMESVEKVLQANKGKPMTAEAIAYALYGDIDAPTLKEERKRISDRLAKGVTFKRWQRIPGQQGVYVLQ
jgi:hypothetical protein